MDKIIYTCSAEYIGFSFPKRKWWEFSKKPREVQFTFVEKFSNEEVLVLMRILENFEAEMETADGARLTLEESVSDSDMPCCIYIPPAYRDEIWQEFIKRSIKKKRYDVLLVVDLYGSSFPELLMKNVEDINYLAVLTKRPEEYEYILNILAREYGLFGMFFSEYKDLMRYQRQICDGRRVLVFSGERSFDEYDGSRRMFFRFPKGSLVLDFDMASDSQKMFRRKRMENDYVSLPIFLDNIIKNRYNSVVNEGLQIKKGRESQLQQNVSRTDDKNKLGEKRKGIKKWKKRRIS